MTINWLIKKKMKLVLHFIAQLNTRLCIFFRLPSNGRLDSH